MDWEDPTAGKNVQEGASHVAPQYTGQQNIADTIELKQYDMSFRRVRHLGLTIKKNFILKSRKPIGCCCEVLLPPLFILLLIFGYSLASLDDIAAEEYMQNPVLNTTDTLRTLICVNANESAYETIPNPIQFPRCIGGVFVIPTFLLANQQFLDDLSAFETEIRNLQPPYDFTTIFEITQRNALTPEERRELAEANPDLVAEVSKVIRTGQFGIVLKDSDIYVERPAGGETTTFERVGNLAAIPTGSQTDQVYQVFRDLAGTKNPSDILHFDAYFVLQKAVYTFEDDGADRGRSVVLSLFHAGEMEFAYNREDDDSTVTCEQIRNIISHFSNTTTMFNSVYNRTKLRLGNEETACRGVWDDEDNAIDFIKSDGADQTWALLVFHAIDEQARTLDYSIRMNYTATPNTGSKTNPYSQGLGGRPHLQYLLSGFASVQSLVFSYPYASKGGIAPRNADSVFSSVPPTTESSNFIQSPMATESYRESEFFKRAGEALPLYICFAFIFPVSRLVSAMVTEKEQRQREGMLIMGLARSSFYLSWFLTYVFLMFLSALIIMLICMDGLFQHADPMVILLHFWLYGISLTAWSIMVSVFFSKARIAATVAPFLLIGFSVPSRIVGTRASVQEQRGMSLLCPSAFGYASEVITGYEGAGVGANFDNIQDNEYSILDGWVFLLFDTFLYMLVAWYLDHVFPSEWGVKLNPFFFLFPSYWCGKPTVRTSKNDPTAPTPILEENQNKGLEEKIVIRDLTKKFSDKATPAVNHLGYGNPNGELAFYEGQIQCILGHNGAGKTTLINMLTGMLEPDAGDCTIYDHSILNEMDEIRKNLGLCPQHNILWDDLTAREHIDYFGRLKGVPGSVLKDLTDKMLDLVNLGSKKDAYAKTLSGGQKRKLSVAIALIGGPRLVFLDEPTAGMDVESRRAMWHLLRRPEILKDRCIVLTTHYMDEADLLGDNVMIMDQGHLHARGSPFYLKQKLGVGYNLSIVMKTGASVSTLEETVKSHVNLAQVLSANGNELRMQLPMFLPVTDDVINAHLVNEEDADLKQLLLDEEDFPRRLEMLSSNVSKSGAHPSVEAILKASRAQSVFPDLFDSLELQKADMIESYGVGVTTLEEVFMKIAMESDHYAGTFESGEDGSRDVVGAKNDNFKLYSITDEDSAPPIEGTQLIMAQFFALFKKRFQFARRDKRTMFFQFILPVLCVILAVGLGKIPLPGQPTTFLDVTQFSDEPLKVPVSSSTEASQFSPFNSAFQYCGEGFEEDYCFIKAPLFLYDNVTATNAAVQTGKELSVYLAETYYQHGEFERPISYSVYDGEEYANSSTVLLHNATWVHSFPTSLNILHNSILSEVYGSGAKVTVQNHPLPLSDYFEEFIRSIQVLLTGIVILLPFTILPSNYVAFVVKERECKAKTLQLVSGVKIYVYWFANFCFDLCAYMVTVCLVLIIFFADSRDEYIGTTDVFFGFLTLFVLYGVSSIICSYAVSFLFDVHTQAQTAVSVGNFITGFALVMAAYIMDEVESTQDINKVLKYIFRIVPSYCLGEGIIRLAQHSAPVVEFALEPDSSSFHWDVLGVDIFYMSISIPLYLVATMFAEYYREFKAKFLAKYKTQDTDTSKQTESLLQNEMGYSAFEEDVQVAKERAEVLHNDDRKGDLVSVRNLSKVWPAPGINNYKTAVNDVTFGVKRGELFAFLGTNGAGKTTTLSCLSGEFPPTSGSATIAGFDIETETREARKHLGFCPQFDALLEHLTVLEHLELYSTLRGVPTKEKEESVTTLLNALGLQQFKKKEAKALSGGNKRKLSVAIALIGGPPVIFLDEPSAGMDPVARRGLWTALEDACKDRCVVLTTHHLEEVEGLSHLQHRVTIMVDAKLQCMGSLQQVKSNFGDAYELEAKLSDASYEDRLHSFMASKYPTSRLEETAGLRFTFKVPMPLKLSDLFRAIEENREALGITDYSISETSLEQVFIRISERAQNAEAEEEEGEKKEKEKSAETSRPLTVNRVRPGSVDGGSEDEMEELTVAE